MPSRGEVLPRNQTEVGSDFENVHACHLLGRDAVPPWERLGEPVTYVASGRQGLALVARELHRLGRRRVVVPGYLCDSMVLPFAAQGWEIVPASVDADLRVRPEEVLAAAVRSGQDTVVLSAEYFGRPPRRAVVDVVRELRSRGVVVIEDETHRVFAPGGVGADFAVASLRKELPVPDGAYVRGALPETVLAEPGRAADLRCRAMRWKSDYVAGRRADKAHLDLFARAEECTDAASAPERMGDATARILRRLDYDGLAAVRRANAALLCAALDGTADLRTLNPPAGDEVPSHLVVAVPDAPALRRALAEKGIYCPIHWPRPSSLPNLGPWPSVYLSIPMDHRYGPDDMRRVADAVRSCLR
jgi:hypothetical protein